MTSARRAKAKKRKRAQQTQFAGFCKWLAEMSKWQKPIEILPEPIHTNVEMRKFYAEFMNTKAEPLVVPATIPSDGVESTNL